MAKQRKARSIRKFKNWFTRERILVITVSVYTGVMVYAHDIVSYIIAGLYILAVATFVAK